MSKKPAPQGGSQVLIYQTDDQKTRLVVRLENETVWLTQGQMADLFQTSKQNVSRHIKNVFDEGELSLGSVVKESLTTAAERGFRGGCEKIAACEGDEESRRREETVES